MKHKYLLLYLLCLLSLGILLIGCTPKVEYYLTLDDNYTLTEGETISLNLNTNAPQEAINYILDTNDIVSIDETLQTITALKAGTVTLVVNYAYLETTTVITVNPKLELSFKEPNIILTEGDTYTLDLLHTNISLNDISLSYTGDLISLKGFNITALKVGTVTITANAADLTTTCTITIQAKPITLAFSQESYSLTVGDTLDILFDYTNIDNINDIILSSSDDSLVSINNHTIISLSSGTCMLTATYRDITACVTLTINKKTYTMKEAEYWIELTDNPDNILMTKEQIASFNTTVYSDYSKTKVLNLSTVDLTYTSSYLTSLINEYTNIDKYTVYNTNGSIINSTQRSEILNNRSMSTITNGTASYAILNNFTEMRSYPTYCYSKDPEFDRFQETGLSASECVIVYHYSLDNAWAFVQAENYRGWIESQYLTPITNDEFKSYYKPNNFVIVTAERIQIGDIVYRLGDKIPYSSKTEKGYNLILPVKNNNTFKEIEYTSLDNVHDHYLDYTYRNLFTLAFKMLGTAYRWGDYEIIGRDCSSTQNAIFKSFGLVMPRNTSNQRSITGYSTSVSSFSISKLETLPKGTLIFTSSHVMMYIGQNEQGIDYLFHNSGSCKLQTAISYGMDKIIGYTIILPL